MSAKRNATRPRGRGVARRAPPATQSGEPSLGSAVARAWQRAGSEVLASQVTPGDLRRVQSRLETGARSSLWLGQSKPVAVLSAIRTDIDAARSLVHASPRGSLARATSAIATLTCWEPPNALRRLAADLMAEALAWRGNAERIADLHPEAGSTLEAARQWSSRGSQDPLLTALLLRMQATLDIELRRFDSSFLGFRQAEEIYRELEDWPQLSQTLLQRSRASYLNQDPKGAFETVETALRLLNRLGAPAVDRLNAMSVLAHALEDLNLCHRALLLAELFAKLARQVDLPVPGLRGDWLQGRLLTRIGEPEAAIPLLETARQGFLAESLFLDAALLSLDLAYAYSFTWHGGYRQRQLAREMLPVFQHHALPGEAAAACSLWAHAALDVGADRALLERVRAELSPLRRGVKPLPKA
jgi:tetratricopeptide (TPR) repeat protein